MVRYSNIPVKPTMSERLVDIFAHLLLGKNKKDLSLILESLFTKAERTMILKRLGIQYMLLKNNDRTIVCDILKVSSSTVAHYAFQLETQKKELTTILKSILLSETLRDFLEDMATEALIQPNLYRSHNKIHSKYQKIKRQRKLL
jgi:Trp operon repressor